MATKLGSLTVGSVIGAGVVLAWYASHSGPVAPSVPDPHLTPGAVAVTSTRELCARGFNQRPRTWHDKAGTLAKYGLPASVAPDVEDDDLIPRCAGGDNDSPLNHWPQRCDKWTDNHRCVAGPARDKDRDEREACAEICRRMDDLYTQLVQVKFSHWPNGFTR